MKHGETTPTKINGINDTVNSIAVDSKNNIYFGKFDGYISCLLVQQHQQK
ncbi:hypothetical protein GL982_12025 (plasmid) [Spiroplasma citri]|nr:hypothetical protein [Spiroplasma citri]QIA74256.1 hypothetical protein GL982_12025 [Spiroplasma citri]